MRLAEATLKCLTDWELPVYIGENSVMMVPQICLGLEEVVSQSYNSKLQRQTTIIVLHTNSTWQLSLPASSRI